MQDKHLRLKVGQLAQRTGLSIRTLHHYDAIGLLSPSLRTPGGARLYDVNDLARLHRIEALKHLACSLSEIKATLDGADAAPQDILRRQIAALDADARRAQRLSRHLQRLLDLLCAGGQAAADDWLDTLELMNVYQRHLNDQELDTLVRPGADAAPPLDPEWMALIDEVRTAMRQAMPGDGPEAQALAWRWMHLVIRMTGNDPALAAKMMALQQAEPRAQDIVGITRGMLAWIGEAFVHARCTLFARHLSAAETEQLRRRQLAQPGYLGAWPALVAELRAQMEAGTDVRADAVQDIVRRWQQLFRDCYCGDDAAFGARVREAMLREPGLQLGVGVDEALLAYLQRAHVVAHHVPAENAGPKPSAMMVAVQRAAHQLLEQPLVLDDPLALAILGEQQVRALRADLDKYRNPMAQGLRSSVVVRSRFADDEWRAASARGVRQYVILGAGLDTSAYRSNDAAGRMFEVDLPATQAWKQQRLREAGIEAPASLRYVPVDFERVSLAEGLARAGFDAGEPTFFSWLGVTMYLDEAAVIDTLRYVAGCAKGSAVLFEYIAPLATLSPMMRIAMEQIAAQLAERGEPWKSYFDPEALSRTVAALGFASSRTWGPDELNQRYLSGRSDGLHISPGPGRLMLAQV